jgi:2-hydroxychromene-2-carboxylate isomerase
MASAEFWYEFASTYSYPAALRVATLADERGVSLIWRPFLLGPIFMAQGWRDSPFNIYPAKGRYMWRDLERTCGAMGVPLKRPDPFPQPSLLAARIALALEGDERSDFSRRVFVAEFGQGLPIGDRATLGALLAACGVDAAARKRRQQGAAQGRMRPRGRDRRRRRAVCRHRGRRSVLGQRPARTGTRLGRARPRRRCSLTLEFLSSRLGA